MAAYSLRPLPRLFLLCLQNRCICFLPGIPLQKQSSGWPRFLILLSSSSFLLSVKNLSNGTIAVSNWCFLGAAFTDAAEEDAVGIHMMAGFPLYLPIDFLWKIYIDIKDPAAVLTIKVIMGSDVAVKTVRHPWHMKLINGTDLTEQV